MVFLWGFGFMVIGWTEEEEEEEERRSLCQGDSTICNPSRHHFHHNHHFFSLRFTNLFWWANLSMKMASLNVFGP
jgi:hypothetical protein